MSDMSMNTRMHLHPNVLLEKELPLSATRDGFGKGLCAAAEQNSRIVGVSADLTESTKMTEFAKQFPERFIQVGVAEQNLVTVGSGLAAEGKIPFCAAFAAFSPGRNWEQIRTTVCYNDQPVKIVGSHAGLTVGPDGATHQMLEDLALMRVLPNMKVVVPADALQAAKATLALAQDSYPAYLRVAREKSPVFTTTETPFLLGKADVYWKGSDVTVVACGPLVYMALQAAYALRHILSVEVINVHTIKPLDVLTILRSVRKTRCLVSVEEHQIAAGLGSAVAEALVQRFPVAMEFIGVHDQFGESGQAKELWKKFNITAPFIISKIKKVCKRK